MNKNIIPRNEEEFSKFLVREYFKYGSVDAVFNNYPDALPISYANYQRILDKWGVVKAAGPNNKLTETIDFFSELIEQEIPLDKLYKKIPHTFQTSAATLYRIMGYIKEGITRRVGCALVITPYDNVKKILVARDVSPPRVELGKTYGEHSLPMGYSRKRDSRRVNIVRILQQEVLVKQTVEGIFPLDLIPSDIEPIIYLDIADVRVAAYHLQLPKKYSAIKNFFSYKLKNYEYMAMDDILTLNKGKSFRMGIREIIMGYRRYLALTKRNLTINPLQEQSFLNKELVTVKVDVEY